MERTKINKLIEYCKEDVQLLAEIFEFALKHKKLYYSKNGIRTEILIELPDDIKREPTNDIKIMTMQIQTLKVYLDGYFNSLLLCETINKKQIIHLQEKVNELVDALENENNSEEFDDPDDKYIELENEISDLKEEIKRLTPKAVIAKPPNFINDAADDLPF